MALNGKPAPERRNFSINLEKVTQIMYIYYTGDMAAEKYGEPEGSNGGNRRATAAD
jgi:hypothetical protein